MWTIRWLPSPATIGEVASTIGTAPRRAARPTQFCEF
jgi:hypothetical protein